MAEDRIDSIVGQQAYKQLDDLTAKLELSQKALVDNIGAAIKLNAVLGNSKSLKDLEINYAKAQKVIADMNKQQEKSIQIEQKQATIRANQAAKESKRITEQSRLYTQLSNTLERLRKDAQDVGARFGENSVQFQKAATQVQNLDAKLKAIDSTLGKSQRYVGEYTRVGKSGFNGLGNSINQVSREIPNFAISAQIGIMALSNNLPILFDNIKQTSASIKAMRAEGQQVPGLFKQLTSAIFSWGTALTLAITLSIIFSKQIGDFFTALFKGSDALKKFADNQKNLNEVYKTSNQSAGEQISKLKILRATAQDMTLSDEQRLKAVRELQEEFPKTYKALSDEIILNGLDKTATDELTKSILEQARARAALGKLSEIQGKVLDLEFQKEKIRNAERSESSRVVGGKSVGAGGFILDIEAQKRDIKVRADLAVQKVEQDKKILKAEEDFLIKFAGLGNLTDAIIGKPDKPKKGSDTLRKDQLELNKARIEAAKEILQAIYSDETKSLNERLAALKLFYEKSEELIKVDKSIQLTETELSTYKIQAIELRSSNDLLNLKTDTRNKEFDIRKQANDKEVAENERLYNIQITSAKKADQELLNQVALGMETRQSLYIQGAENELLVLSEGFANGEMTAEQYSQRRLEIQHRLNQNLISAEIEQVQFLIDIQKLAGKDTASEEKKLLELKQKYAKENTDYQIDQLETLAEREAALIAKRKEIVQEFGNFAIAIVQGQFQQSEDTLKKESEQIDIKKAKDLEAVERSIASEQDKAARIAIINAKAQSQKEAIERRQRQLDLDRARFEKQAGIAKIIIDTASAVVQALPNIPLSILVGALGVAQLATAVATPLPKFKGGGKMPYTGLAEYGHGTELRIDPDGAMSLTGSKPEVGLVKKGTEFVSNPELMRMLAKPDKMQWAGGMSIDLNKVIEATENSGKRVENAVYSLRQKSGGINYYSTSKGREYLKRNL